MAKLWVPVVTSIGIGAAAYQLMRPNNKVANMVKQRMNHMMEEKEWFPNK